VAATANDAFGIPHADQVWKTTFMTLHSTSTRQGSQGSRIVDVCHAWNRNILAIGVAASLALSGVAVAQTRLALTSPNVGPDPLDTPLPSFSRPPPADITAPRGNGQRVSPGFGIPPRPAAAAPPELRGNPLWAIPLKDFVFTRDRPLFSPSRRPATAPVAYVAPSRPVVALRPAEPELPKLTLIGVILSEKDGIGIFVDGATREVIRLRKNRGARHPATRRRTCSGRSAFGQRSVAERARTATLSAGYFAFRFLTMPADQLSFGIFASSTIFCSFATSSRN
jgi:general secretion pathway protein N